MGIQKLVLIAVLFVYSHTAAAVSCFEKSPDYARLGDAYFEYVPVKLSNVHRKNLEALLLGLSGRWDATVEEMLCKGSDKNPNVIYKTASAKATLSKPTAISLKVDLSKYYRDDRVTKHERIALLDSAAISRIDVTSNRLSAAEKRRQILYGRTARLSEISYTMHKSASKLSINLMHYENGYLILSQTLRLDKQ